SRTHRLRTGKISGSRKAVSRGRRKIPKYRRWTRSSLLGGSLSLQGDARQHAAQGNGAGVQDSLPGFELGEKSVRLGIGPTRLVFTASMCLAPFILLSIDRP